MDSIDQPFYQLLIFEHLACAMYIETKVRNGLSPKEFLLYYNFEKGKRNNYV